jgi:hypothetical protein
LKKFHSPGRYGNFSKKITDSDNLLVSSEPRDSRGMMKMPGASGYGDTAGSVKEGLIFNRKFREAYFLRQKN